MTIIAGAVTGTHSSGTSWTGNVTVDAAHNLLVVGVSTYGSSPVPTVSGVTYNGVALTKLDSQLHDGTRLNQELWFLVNPSGGDNALTVTLTGDSDEINVTTRSYGGTAGVGGHAVNVAVNTSSVAATVAGAASDSLVTDYLDFWDSGSGFTYTPNGGQTSVYQDNQGGGPQSQFWSDEASLGGDVDMGWSWNGTNNESAALVAWEVLSEAASTAPVSNDASLHWRLFNSIITNTDLRWNLLQRLATDAHLQWSLHSSITADSALAWRLLSTISRDADLRWSTRQPAENDLAAHWDIASALASVSTDLAAHWNVLQAINATLTHRWDIRTDVFSSAQLLWSLVSKTTGDLGLAWSLVQRLTADLESRWEVHQNISQNVGLIWDMESALQTVDADLALSWDLRRAIAATLDTRWDLLRTVGVDADMRWDIANSVITDLQLNHRLLANVAADADLRWDALSFSDNSLTLSWSLGGETVSSVSFIRVPAERRVFRRPEPRIFAIPAEQRVLHAHA
jgi:hypothetical protein